MRAGLPHGLIEADDLVLHAFAPLHGQAQQRLQLCGRAVPVGVDEFDEAGEGLADGVAVAGRHVGVQLEVAREVPGEVEGAQVPERLGQVVDDEAVAGGEQLGPDHVDLPSGQVVVDAVHVRRVVVGVGQRLEQVGGGQHGGHGAHGVADEDHGRLRCRGAVAPREGLVRQVVLHRVDQVLLNALAPGELVEGDDVPESDEADPVGRVVDEEFRQGDLAAGHQDPVG